MSQDLLFDFERSDRIGLSEALYCESKSPAHIEAAVAQLAQRDMSVLLTRLDEVKYAQLGDAVRALLDYDAVSHTAVLGTLPMPSMPPRIAIATAGTSDLATAAEASRTLAFYGESAEIMADLGVAGLWRLLEHRAQLASFPVIIAIAGMEGAFFSVLGGLLGNPIIAVPTSTGYGVTSGGQTALHAALGSCAPGILVVNIDNGFGAACAALRILSQSVRPIS